MLRELKIHLISILCCSMLLGCKQAKTNEEKIAARYFTDAELARCKKLFFCVDGFGCKGCNKHAQLLADSFMSFAQNFMITDDSMMAARFPDRARFDVFLLIKNTETEFLNSCVYTCKNGKLTLLKEAEAVDLPAFDSLLLQTISSEH